MSAAASIPDDPYAKSALRGWMDQHSGTLVDTCRSRNQGSKGAWTATFESINAAVNNEYALDFLDEERCLAHPLLAKHMRSWLRTHALVCVSIKTLMGVSQGIVFSFSL